MTQLRVAVLYGGIGPERAISIRSATNVYLGLIANDCEAHCIFIGADGTWRYVGTRPPSDDETGPIIAISPGKGTFAWQAGAKSIEFRPDIIFPSLHGLGGEDGSIQGLAFALGIPCAGSPILGSAIGMDKDIAKRLVASAGFQVAPWMSTSCDDSDAEWRVITETLGTDVFVKPVGSGSSIGVCRVSFEHDFARAKAEAARYSTRIIIESAIVGREIECGVLQTPDGLIASELGEVRLGGHHPFYDYEAKYETTGCVDLTVPVELPAPLRSEVQATSISIFRALRLQGFARLDYFLTEDGRIIFNEVNTLPGFTDLSMFPRMFAQSGYSLDTLVKCMIDAAH